MNLHRTIPVRKTARRQKVAPSEPGVREAQLQRGFERLLAEAKDELIARGVDTTGMADMAIIGMARDERRKTSFAPRKRVTVCT